MMANRDYGSDSAVAVGNSEVSVSPGTHNAGGDIKDTEHT